MPHIIVEYSANLEEDVDLADLCDVLRASAAAQEIFPETGVRVRAIRCEIYSIADGDPRNGFIDISVRLREGRPLDKRKAATDLSDKEISLICKRGVAAEALADAQKKLAEEARRL